MNNDAKISTEIFRKDHPMILATNRHLATLLPVRVAYRSQGYEAGRVVGRITASGIYDRYDNAGSGGLEVAAGVLFEAVKAEEFAGGTGTAVARCIFGGEVFKDKLVGLDTAAETDLAARTVIDASGVSILKF